MRRVSTGLTIILLAACGPAPRDSTPVGQPKGQVIGEFEALVDPVQGTMTFTQFGQTSRGLFEAVTIQDSNPNGNPPNSTHLVSTNINFDADGSGPCGFASSFCADVEVGNFYAGMLTDVFVELTNISPAAGHTALNSAPPEQGLSDAFGLWDYGTVAGGGGSSSVQWVLGDDGASYRIRGHVMANLCFDGVQDGDETGVDCGGSCAACGDNYFIMVLSDNAVAYYRLDEAAGTVANDSSITENHAAIQGTPVFNVAGVRPANGAMGFDGDSNVVAFGSPYPPSFTAEAWARSNTATWNDSGWIVSARDINGFLIHPNAGTNSVGFYMIDFFNSYFHIGDFIVGDITVYHQYAITFDNTTGEARAYIDGNTVGVSFFPPGARMDTTGSLMIGRDNCCGMRFGNGDIDEVSTYETVLSPARILQHFNAGVGP